MSGSSVVQHRPKGNEDRQQFAWNGVLHRAEGVREHGWTVENYWSMGSGTSDRSCCSRWTTPSLSADRHPSGAGSVELPPNLCLDNPGASTTPGTRVNIWTCNGSEAQAWRFR